MAEHTGLTALQMDIALPPGGGPELIGVGPGAADGAAGDTATADGAAEGAETTHSQPGSASASYERVEAKLAAKAAALAAQTAGTQQDQVKPDEKTGVAPGGDAAGGDLVAKVIASVRANPVDPAKVAANPALEEAQAQLAAALAEIKTLKAGAHAQVKEEDGDGDGSEKSPWARSVSSRFAGLARDELDDGTPEYLINEYTDALSLIAQAEGYVESSNEGQAKAAKAQVATAIASMRRIQVEAQTKAVARAVAEMSKAKSATVDLAPAREAKVQAMLSDPGLADKLTEFPGLAAALKAGVVTPSEISYGIDYNSDWQSINDVAEANMSRLNTMFSRIQFGAPADPTVAADNGGEEKQAGVRVGNPSAFAARRDEPSGSPKRPNGPGTMQESMARVAAKLAARQPERRSA